MNRSLQNSLPFPNQLATYSVLVTFSSLADLQSSFLVLLLLQMGAEIKNRTSLSCLVISEAEQPDSITALFYTTSTLLTLNTLPPPHTHTLCIQINIGFWCHICITWYFWSCCCYIIIVIVGMVTLFGGRYSFF